MTEAKLLQVMKSRILVEERKHHGPNNIPQARIKMVMEYGSCEELLEEEYFDNDFQNSTNAVLFVLECVGHKMDRKKFTEVKEIKYVRSKLSIPYFPPSST